MARLKDDGLLTLHTQAFVPSTPNRLQLARTCYDHMAGTLAMHLHDHFLASGWLVGDGTYVLTAPGETAMVALWLDMPALREQRRRFACACLDWSMRRPHLAGALGAAVLQCVIRRGWVTQDLDSRALGVTAKGRKAFAARFGIHTAGQ